MEPKTLAPHVLKLLARYQTEGRRATLQDLVDELFVRRGDVRATISALHVEGYLDATRLRLTMMGFAHGVSLLDVQLPALRRLTLVRACAA
jgi:Mn-dependent DtxR family transcriptional regulator